jgi:predicted CopG family antitoxin
MGTKKKKNWKTIRVDEETYLKLKRNAEIREMSLSQIISFLINQNGKINTKV